MNQNSWLSNFIWSFGNSPLIPFAVGIFGYFLGTKKDSSGTQSPLLGGSAEPESDNKRYLMYALIGLVGLVGLYLIFRKK